MNNYTSSNSESNKRRIMPVALIVTAVILAAALGGMIYMFYSQRDNMYEMERFLTEEKDSLANELVMLSQGYEDLKTDNDTLNAKLDEEKSKIDRLLSINASNTSKIRSYKKEISTMRNIMKSYIVQIDSLNSRNKKLVAQNKEIKEDLTKATETNVELEKVKDELSTKVEIASVIKGANVLATCLNKKRKVTERLNRMVNLRVCVTLRENPIVEPGEKIVFLRLTRPDGLLVSSSPDNTFMFGNESLIFTESRAVDYINKDVELCIFVNKTTDFIKGSYLVELFLEGENIGKSEFLLK